MAEIGDTLRASFCLHTPWIFEDCNGPAYVKSEVMSNWNPATPAMSNLKLRGSYREQQVLSDVHMAGDAGFQPSTIPVDFETCPYMFHIMPQMDAGHVCIQCKRHPFPFSSRIEFPSPLQSASEVHTVAQKAPQGRKLMIINSTHLDKHIQNMSTSTFIRGRGRNWKASLCS